MIKPTELQTIILDEVSRPVKEQVFLKKSTTTLKIYLSLFVISVFLAIMAPYLMAYREIIQLLIGLTMLSVFIMAPAGLYFSIRSYGRKEGTAPKRLRYLSVHMLFCMMAIVSISAFVYDLMRMMN